MIKILNSGYNTLAIIKKVLNASIENEINGEYTFTFDCILDEKTAQYVQENNVVEIEENYFDIISYRKNKNEDGTLVINVECEHISYRLNYTEYNLDTFTQTGTPVQILTQILSGTAFSVGTVEPGGSFTYSAQEAKSRRQILMEFVYMIGLELEFNKLEISIKTHIGDSSPKLLAKSKNVNVISKTYNAREKNENGQPLITYEVNVIQLPTFSLFLGDEVLLVNKELEIQEELRVVKISYNPYEKINVDIELTNFIHGLEDQIYRIQTEQVKKDKIYNGAKIGPDEGIVVERSDGKAKTIMNATDGISVYADTGSGLERNFYVDTGGRIQAKNIDIAGSGTFGGSISAATISGSTITGGTVSAATISGSAITGGSISIGTSNNVFKVDTDGNMWLGHANYANAPFKVNTAGVLSATGAIISGSLTITGGSGISNLSDAGNLATKDNITMNYVTDAGNLATRDTIGTGQVDSTIISGGKVVTGLLTASNIRTGTLNASLVSVTNINASNINTGTLNASLVSVTNLNASNINTGTLNASLVSVTNINASNINTGTLSAARINTSGLYAERILQPSSSDNYGTIGGSYGDLALYYNNYEYFRIENALGGAVNFKTGGSYYPFSLRSNAVEVKTELEIKSNTGNGNYAHYLYPGTDGRYGLIKNNSGTWQWDGQYFEPTSYLMGSVKANNYKYYTKFDVSNDKIIHYASNSTTGGNYIETTGESTKGKNNWNFDGTLRYKGTHVVRAYYDNDEIALNWSNYGGTYGCLEVWFDGNFKGYIKINDK